MRVFLFSPGVDSPFSGRYPSRVVRINVFAVSSYKDNTIHNEDTPENWTHRACARVLSSVGLII